MCLKNSKIKNKQDTFNLIMEFNLNYTHIVYYTNTKMYWDAKQHLNATIVQRI